ncbi:hypothetical protein PoMZ_09923 [Pyricularia oryzae]|uniref:Uncharacterized protein n=1 Tax=Pyricularia oryzae TaxID=318829 RepID=A0A4P7MW04_PYROR|nr:hypothetical protein PoMZ_09923 [Pyricularia oryzae]
MYMYDPSTPASVSISVDFNRFMDEPRAEEQAADSYFEGLAGRSIPSVWLFLTVYTLAECVWTGEASSGGNGDGDNWNGALQVRYCHAIYDGIAPLDQIVQLTDYRAACPGPIRIRHS